MTRWVRVAEGNVARIVVVLLERVVRWSVVLRVRVGLRGGTGRARRWAGAGEERGIMGGRWKVWRGAGPGVVIGGGGHWGRKVLAQLEGDLLDSRARNAEREGTY